MVSLLKTWRTLMTIFRIFRAIIDVALLELVRKQDKMLNKVIIPEDTLHIQIIELVQTRLWAVMLEMPFMLSSKMIVALRLEVAANLLRDV